MSRVFALGNLEGAEDQGAYQVFLEKRAKRLSWPETATIFVQVGAVCLVQSRLWWNIGFPNRSIEGFEKMGVDEIHVQENRFLHLFVVS